MSMFSSILRMRNGGFSIRRIQQHYASSSRFVSIMSASALRSGVSVAFDNGSSFQFPYVFLRDSCECPECFEPSSKQRLLQSERDAPINITGEPTINEQGSLEMTWRTNTNNNIMMHKSIFSGKWLFQHLPSSAQHRPPFPPTSPHLWTALEMQRNRNKNGEVGIPRVDFQAVMTNDVEFCNWIELLSKFGIVILNNAPAEEGQLKLLGKRASPVGLRRTNYGEIFTVRAKIDPSNLAYTSSGLALHSDLVFYKNKPDIQMLHCLKQARIGGEGVFADAFCAALDMKVSDPEAFDVLCKLPFTFVDTGIDAEGEYDLKFERTAIELDLEGHITSVNINNHSRQARVLPGGADATEAQFRAYYKLVEMLNSSKYAFEMLLNEGDILAFNNSRVMHGRRAFRNNRLHHTNSGGSNTLERHLEGAYLDIDDLWSRARVLHSGRNSPAAEGTNTNAIADHHL